MNKNVISELENAIRDDVYAFNQNDGLQQKTDLIDGFLHFYFEVLNYNSKDFFNLSTSYYSNLKESISSLLTESGLAIAKNRKNWFQIFLDPLENDLEFFKLVFKKMCNINIRTNYSVSLSENEKSIINQRNEELIYFLIEIGKKNEHFKHFKEEDFLSSNTNFVDIFTEEKIFQREFTLEKLLEYLYELKENKKNSRYNNPFINTYFYQILEYHEKHQDLILKIKENDLEEIFIQNFFTQIPNELLVKISKEKMDLDTFIQNKKQRTENDNFQKTQKFIASLIRDKSFKEYLAKNENYQSTILTSFTPVYAELIESYSNDLKYFRYSNYNFNRDTFSRYNNNFLNNLYIINKSGYVIDFDDDLQHVFQTLFKNMKLYTKEEQSYNKKQENPLLAEEIFVNFVAEYIEKYEKIGKFNSPKLLEYIKNNLNIFQHLFHLSSDNRYSNIFLSSQFLNYIEKHLPEKTFEKFLNKSITNLQISLYKEIHNNGKNYYSYKQEEVVQNLCVFLRETEHYNVLDILNVNDKEKIWLDFTYMVSSKKREEKNLAYEIIEKTQGKAIEWFIKEENIEDTIKIRFKNKSIISYFKNESWFPDMLLYISKKPESFKKLILNNKPAFNIVNNFINKNIILNNKEKIQQITKVINYLTLNNKITQKEDTIENVPKKKNKI